MKQKSEPNNFITIERISKSIQPKWELKHWFKWPPDMFALMSTILQRTGAYKVCLTDNQNEDPWDQVSWQNNIEGDAIKWIEYSNRILLSKKGDRFPSFPTFSPKVKEAYTLIKSVWGTFNLDNLRLIDDIHDSQMQEHELEDIKKIAGAFIVILAVADSCGRSLGAIGKDEDNDNRKLKLFHGAANLLLNNTGSLSTIPKFAGIVLPKMRTPQSGLVFRGLSLYLTFHLTEVEVMWRTFPWLNNHKLSLNVLGVPYPKYINPNSFEILDDRNHVTNYFQIKSVKEKDGDSFSDRPFLKNLVEYVCSKHKNQIDIIIFPEQSLHIDDYKYFLQKLEVEGTKENEQIEQFPIIIAGVLDGKKKRNSTTKSLDHKRIGNQLIISIFFAGKWYNIRQNKHHRWLLDSNQIRQYNLENVLPTDKNVYEYISICQRRLAVLAPNYSLALASLICEDLARQEPVGELIRGIAPTLLVALLSDGPQLTNRWSARYASVLADDPGIAVLSLTSQGMAERSINYSNGNSPNVVNSDKGVIVGLWKDMIRGWKEIGIGKGKNNEKDEKNYIDVLHFTISAMFKEEVTLDRRTDHNYAPVFQMDSFKVITNSVCLTGSTEEFPDNYDMGYWDDMRELSAISFLFDAIIDLLSVEDDQLDAFCKADYLLSLLPFNESNSTIRADCVLPDLIRLSWKSPECFGTAHNGHEKRLQDFKIGINEINTIINHLKSLKNEKHNKYYKYYKAIKELCERKLSEIESEFASHNIDNQFVLDNRTKKIPYAVLLTIINAKISNWKSRKDMLKNGSRSDGDASDIKWSEVLDLKKDIKRILNDNLQKIKLKH